MMRRRGRTRKSWRRCLLDENEVEMVALVAKQEQKERMPMAKKRKVDQLETNKLMTAPECPFFCLLKIITVS